MRSTFVACFLAPFCLAVPGAAQAEAPGDLRAAITSAKERIYPALVNIQVVAQDFSGGRAVRSLRAGSGTILDENGHVLTNYHVARDAVRLVCTLPSGQQIGADVVGHDAPTDISVLRLRLADRTADSGPLPHASLGDSDQVQVGDPVLAVGNPLSLSSSMTLGIVSNTKRVFLSGFGNELEELDFGSGDRTGLFTVWIQHDALILPGSSGGPLVNLRGEIVGVNTRAATGYGFASPANLVKRVVAQILEHGEVRRGFLGVAFQPVAKLGRERGALVASIVRGSPAEAAGLLPGDFVLTLGGAPVVVRFFEQVPLLYGRIADLGAGQTLAIGYERDGQESTVTVTLARMEEFLGREAEQRELGVTLQDITPPMAIERGYPDTKGVVVTGLRAGKPFEAALPRLQIGDVVVKVAGQPVADIRGFERAIAEAKGKEVAIECRRQRQSVVTVVDTETAEVRPRGGELAKAWLGVQTQVLTPKVAQACGVPGQRGFRVTEVYPETKAAAAGLEVGDLIVAVGDQPLEASRIQDERDLRNRIENLSIGDDVELGVLRDGQTKKLTVELEATPASAQEAKKAKHDLFELQVRELTRWDRVENDLPVDLQGVWVSEATSGGWAFLAGIAAGQILLRIDGRPVGSVPAFEAVLADLVKKQPAVVPVFVRQGRRTMFRFIEPDWSRGPRSGETGKEPGKVDR